MTIKTPNGLPADLLVSVQREDSQVQVYLAEGGENFPWTVHNDTVLLGPPTEDVVVDGITLDSMSWTVSPYWVIEAIDAQGNEITLTPSEYQSVVHSDT